MAGVPITAHPIRIIPFDLGRQLLPEDIASINNTEYKQIELTPRQSSILKGLISSFAINDHLSAYIYNNGMCVLVVEEEPILFKNDYEHFSITYGENRKRAHSAFFKWEHKDSDTIWNVVANLRNIVHRNTPKKITLRKSGNEQFENRGLSYIMTLSMFDVDPEVVPGNRFSSYPDWLKSNIYALLDPAVLYLEDSSKFESATEVDFDLNRILKELEINQDLNDYERHRHINTYMSWAAVTTFGQLQAIDKEEYTALEVQLQCDWFYVYCLDKSLDDLTHPTRKDIVEIQQQNYEVDLLENRLYDFDDSSMPTRILDIQKGLVDTSGLEGNIQHLQRKIRFILERERLNSELKQKRLGQSTEILLFIIAFIEIAPTVAEYGNGLYSNAGTLANVLIVILGIILLIRKN